MIRNLKHAGANGFDALCHQSVGVIVLAVAAAAKADDVHAGGQSGIHAMHAVLYDDTLGGCDTEAARRMFEQVGIGLGTRHVI